MEKNSGLFNADRTNSNIHQSSEQGNNKNITDKNSKQGGKFAVRYPYLFLYFKDYNYTPIKKVGVGTFGVVYKAKIVETNEIVAIKKVFQDPRYKNRELQIMKELKHLNTCNLHHYFFSYDEKNKKDVFLHCVMDYVPETLYRIIRYYRKIQTPFPEILLKIYSYQLLRSLAYIHGKGITHRDIKPQNVLIDPSSHLLKLCDFGSAKKIIQGKPNIAYICSRYYRAPELIFGATQYGPAIDMWSAGALIAEMILGQPIFPGDSSIHQLVQIIKILGTPTKALINEMNPNSEETKLPQLKKQDWKKVFWKHKVSGQCTDFISQILQYSPTKRMKPLPGLLHPFFDDLRAKNCKINGRQIPDLFNFTKEELKFEPSLYSKLVPEWYLKKKRQANKKQ